MALNWQRANLQAAATYMRERINGGAGDARTRAVYEGLLDVLEPTRRLTRQQRELAVAAQAAVTIDANRDRRASSDRRGRDRRVVNFGPPGGIERRRGGDRRAGRDRRKNS